MYYYPPCTRSPFLLLLTVPFPPHTQFSLLFSYVLALVKDMQAADSNTKNVLIRVHDDIIFISIKMAPYVAILGVDEGPWLVKITKRAPI